MRSIFLLLLSGVFYYNASAQNIDISKCTNNESRSWWDVQHYDLNLKIDTATGNMEGSVTIKATVKDKPGASLQIDLQEPLHIKAVTAIDKNGTQIHLNASQTGDHYLITGDFNSLLKDHSFSLMIDYNGVPKIAARPPWDGGLVKKRDENGLPWLAMACQGAGASIWFPCKDFQGDEADSGMTLSMLVPANLQMIGNGRLQPNNERRSDGNLRWTWSVVNPINNYDITFYIGDYVHWSDTLQGVNGPLTLDYYALRNNEAKAKEQFKVVKPMLHCFENKMGAYPFYEDGYKLVEAPYLGMEHQSAVAYGNKYLMGYEGMDRSRTGVGLLFDFIIVHESGHEWFGNSITAYDLADTWIHEGFTTYTETIFAECLLGRDSAFIYQRGKIHTINNDKPVQGAFNSCDEGSSDHYDKAAFMIHMIRMIMNDDDSFFAMLRSMNKTFYHKIITGKEMEAFINQASSKDFSKVFDQYLRSKDIPQFDIVYKKDFNFYRWTNCVDGFNMPVLVHQNKKNLWLYPTKKWKQIHKEKGNIVADKNFLIEEK